MEVFDETDYDVNEPCNTLLGCGVFIFIFIFIGIIGYIIHPSDGLKEIQTVCDKYPTYPPRHANAPIPQKPESKLAKEIYARLKDESRWKKGKTDSGTTELGNYWYSNSFTDGEFEVHKFVGRWSTGYSIWLNSKPLLYDVIDVCELEYLDYAAEETYKKLEKAEDKKRWTEEDKVRLEKANELLKNLKERIND